MRPPEPIPTAAGEDLFLLPRGSDRYYLYAPLRRRAAVINGSAANVVAKYLAEGAAALEPAGVSLVKSLYEQGFIDDAPPDPPVFPEKYDFFPHEVTLFPTTRCNLECRYCYADAGKRIVDMPRDIAKAAIDLTAKNAGLLGSEKFAVGFHGGGEPTVAWDFVVHAVEYAHAKAEEMGLDAEIYCASNGLLSKKQREFIVNSFTTLNVSLDGPRDIQDFNRPKQGGGGSYEDIRRSLLYFNEKDFHYGIRTTVTADTVHRMEEIVERFHEEFNLAYLHMEPAWQCGRCFTSGEKAPPDEDFIANFRKAAAKGGELGIDVHYSGARPDVLTSKFCAAPGDGFNVLPEGLVTSCFEVMTADDPRAAIFHYGNYEPGSGSFVFDKQRIAALQNLSVEHLPFCGDCFCKWHCAGDCLAKVFAHSGSAVHQGSIRCKLNRELTLAKLDEMVEDNKKKQEDNDE